MVLTVKTDEHHFMQGFVILQKLPDSFDSNVRCSLLREALDSGADIGKCNSFYSVIHRRTQ